MAGEPREERRAHIFVFGRVQGVGYRHFVLQTARRLGVRGWVRNRLDGSVEVMAQAPAGVLDGFIQILRAGPPLAAVTDVQISWEPPAPAESPFRVRGTL